MNERNVLTNRPWRRPQYLSSVPYLPGLDGMRALAVAIVVVYHANSSWLHGGFLGVEVFFVISGYLITLLLMAETERTGRVDLVGFWGRRIRRLLPALFVLLAAVVVYTAIFRSDRLSEIRGDVAAAIVYISNWWQIWVGADYAGADRFAPLNHLWSLAVEEQFYLIWPLVMLLLLRRGSRKVARVAVWLVALALLITVVNSVLIYTGPVVNCEITPDAYWQAAGRCFNKPNTLYLSTLNRASGLLLGSAFAMLWRPMAIMRGPLREANVVLDILGLLGLVGIGALSWWLFFVGPNGADGWLFRGGFLATDIATLMVIAAVTHRYTLIGRFLGNPVFVWVGQRSYGIYLYHWFIFQIIRRVTGIGLTPVQFAGAMVASIVVAEASYRFIETPIRKRQVGAWWAKLRRQSDPVPRQVVMVMSVVLVAVVGFGTFRMVTAATPTDTLGDSLAAGEGSTVDIDDILNGTVPTGTVPSQSTPTTLVPGAVTTPTSAVATTTTTTVPPSTTTPLPEGRIDKLAIGDSVMLGAAPYLAEQNWFVLAEQGRQMKDAIPFLQQLKDADKIGIPVFIHLGTNGPITRETVDELMAALADIPVVILFNVHGPVGWRDQNNQILAERDKPNDNIVLVDWDSLAAQCPGDCFYGDGYHLKPDGQKYYERVATGIWTGDPP